jgi:hypothetical protein
MTDIWFCSTCHSINRQRDSRCYKCHAPQDEGASAGTELRVGAAIANRSVVPYRSSWLLAVIAIVLILIFAALGIGLLLASLGDVDWLRGQVTIILNGGTLDQAELARRTLRLAVPTLLRLAVALGALITFAAWLSRVMSNIPALGGGTPGTTPTKAFIYPLIPLWNLIKVPGMIQDALYRVDPRAGGFFMVAVAWFGLVGSWFISFIGGWVLSFGLSSSLAAARTRDGRVAAVQGWFDQTIVLDLLTTLLVAGGAVVLAMVMVRIERRCAARDHEIRAALAGLPDAPAQAPAPDPLPVTPE